MQPFAFLLLTVRCRLNHRLLRDIHFAQLKSYLRTTRLRVGPLFNFNAPTLSIKRMVLD